MNLCNFCKKEIIDIDNSSKFCSHNCKLKHFKKRYPPKKEKNVIFVIIRSILTFLGLLRLLQKVQTKVNMLDGEQ